MATLYELTEQAAALYELLQNEEINEETFTDTLEAIGAGDKVEGYCQIIKQLQSDADMFKGEIDRLQARKKAADNGIDRMKAALLLFLQQSGQDRIKANTFTVSLATTQAVNITNGAELPPEYLIEQPAKIDKIGIKKALKEGVTVAGAELVNNTGVRIR